MELWFIVLLSFCLCAALKFFIHLFSHGKTKQTKLSLPPGPPKVPIIGNLLWLYQSFSQLEPIFHSLRLKYGPIITLHIGSRPTIFIATHSLAHQALVKNGAAIADRPASIASGRIISSNQHSINAAAYGPLWRLLRRNLTSEILHPSRAKSYSHARKWVLQILVDQLRFHVESGEPVHVMDHFQYAMFCLLVFMCFGERVDEKVIREVENVEKTLLVNFRLGNFEFFPTLGRIFFRNRWQQLLDLRQKQDSVMTHLIRARRERKEKNQEDLDEPPFVCYVDTMLNLQIPDEGERKLTEQEMVTLCSEFLNAGTDTTSTALQWIMANLVKNPEIQEKLYSEIKGVVAVDEEIKEEDLPKMTYLKAVVLEGLRRHPPGHFVLPHAVTEDIVLDGHVIPKNATLNFSVSEMGRDPKVWKDPMEFKPERFLSDEGEGFDITGTKEIKMMPFGAGRRICPGHRLAVLHLEYFIANLIRDFKWTAVDGVDVDFTEKPEFTVVMKNPLQAHISPRLHG